MVLTTERRGDGVAVLTLDRPEKRNALNRELRQALVESLHGLGVDDAVRTVVLTGAGSAFCAGFDLDELMSSDHHGSVFADAEAYHHAVHTFAKPLVAAIEGPAVAGGMDLALMCDVRVASSNARFGQPQVKLGVPASFELIRSIVSDPVARELCLTARVIGADEALEIGLINEMVAPGAALERAEALAFDIAEVAGAAAMKQMFVATQPPLFGDRE